MCVEAEDNKAQTVNINLFKRDLAPINVKPAEDRYDFE